MKARLKNAYKKQGSLRAAAKHLNMSRPTLYRLMRQYNIKMNPRGGANKPKILDRLQQETDVMQIVKDAKNLEEAADKLGVCYGTLHKWLKGKKV